MCRYPGQVNSGVGDSQHIENTGRGGCHEERSCGRGFPVSVAQGPWGKTGHAVPTGGDNMVRGKTMNPDY